MLEGKEREKGATRKIQSESRTLVHTYDMVDSTINTIGTISTATIARVLERCVCRGGGGRVGVAYKHDQEKEEQRL